MSFKYKLVKILFCLEKDWYSDMCCIMDKQNMLHIERQALCDSTAVQGWKSSS